MNNNPRIYLWIALAAILWFNFEAWNRDYAGPAAQSASPAAPSAAPAGAAPSLADRIPQAVPGNAAPSSGSTAAGERAKDAPGSVMSPGPAGAAQAATPAGGPATATPTGSETAPPLRVRTDVLELTISRQGGTIEAAQLLKYAQVKGEAERVQLERSSPPQALYLLQSGLTGAAGPDYPNHLAPFSSDRSSYELGSGSELRVPLTWSHDGVTVTKTFIFHRGAYRFEVEYRIANHGSSAWQAAPYAQILRNDPPGKRSMFNVESYAFHGPAIYDGTKYRKLDISNADDAKLAQDVTNGWLAALQHHFVSAIVPAAGTPYRFTLSTSGTQYLLAASGPERTVPPGGSDTLATTLYIGPKLQSQLEGTGPRLELVADYGKLTILAKPLFKALGYVHAVTGNWGLAIILVTFLLKLIFYPLSEASGRSMAKMKTLQPRIKNLQDTYKDDREKLGRAMMELYQREKVNPVAGCLPIIIQIPVFLAFYWVLLESVEMRQAPFAFWIQDLSARDPLFVLPAIMAGAMFLQYKLNPAPPDPVQAKVFMIMPLVMSATFAFFPAGLVLYWVTNTLLSIAQQWNINRRIAAATKS